MIEWHDFPNFNFFKMLSFSQVTEAYGLIYPRPSGENFSFVCSRNEKNSFSVVFGLNFRGGESLGANCLRGKPGVSRTMYQNTERSSSINM